METALLQLLLLNDLAHHEKGIEDAGGVVTALVPIYGEDRFTHEFAHESTYFKRPLVMRFILTYLSVTASVATVSRVTNRWNRWWF